MPLGVISAQGFYILPQALGKIFSSVFLKFGFLRSSAVNFYIKCARRPLALGFYSQEKPSELVRW